MRETKNMEFKEQITNTFLKTVSAFANYGTGQIVFGVADNGTIVGVKNRREACLAIENKINDSINPAPDYTLTQNSHNNTITLTVRVGPHKPYFYKTRAYKRGDTSTIEVDRLELNRLILQGENLTFDATPAHTDELMFKTLEQHAQPALGITSINDDILKTLELEDSEGKFNIASELLSDVNNAPGIDVARFGNNISIFKERATFEHESVLLQYENALEMFRRNYCFEVVHGAKRIPQENIPEQAYREAIANALVHRQWDINTHIKVSMFDDRIEITSPGGLTCGISEEEYLDGQISILRNPILGNVFFRLGIIERFGTGVLRIKESYEGSAAKPSFYVSENSIKVVLPKITNGENLTDDEATVHRIIEGKTLAISEIANIAKFGKSKTRSLLKSLVSKGYAETVGAGRGTKYKG